MTLSDAPIATDGFFVTHFFTVRDQEKSKDFYVRILGGKVVKPSDPCYIKLANSWIILNSGGGPTDDIADGHPHDPARPRPHQRLPQRSGGRHSEGVQGVVSQGRGVPH